MSISTYGSLKMVVCIMFAMNYLCGCSPQVEDSQKEDQDYSKLVAEYNDAVKQADKKDPNGFLKIYAIAATGESAEISEIARDKLHHLLYNNPELWIKTFSAGDSESFKAYLKNGGMAVLEFPENIASQEQYEGEIATKLKAFRGNEKELELVRYMLQFYEERPSKERKAD